MNFPMPITVLTRPVLMPAPAHEPAPPQAMNLIRVVVEALMGRRPLHQVRPHLAHGAFENLSRYVDSGAFKRIRVGRVRSQMPTVRAVEATVCVEVNGRSMSCVLRLDAKRTSWRCTELIVLAPVGVLDQVAA